MLSLVERRWRWMWSGWLAPSFNRPQFNLDFR